MHVSVPDASNGGVNATCICANGTLRGLFSTLVVPRIPLFCDEDADLFFELIKNARVLLRNTPCPGDEVYCSKRPFFEDVKKWRAERLSKR